MFEFGLYALILLLTALGFVIVPLMIAKPVIRETDDAINIDLAKFKLRELEMDLSAANITKAQFTAAKKELEIGLYHDLKDSAEQNLIGGNGRWLAVPLGFILPVVALALYAQLGDFRSFESKSMQTGQTEQNTEDQVNEMVAKLAQRLQQQPNDLQGWIMLGRSYKAMKRYPDAVAAFKNALALQGDNTDIMLQIADTLAMLNDGSLQGEATQLIERALSLKPDSKMALWLAGQSKAEQGQFDAAVVLWQKLQKFYQPGGEDYLEVQSLINMALERSGKEVVSAEVATQPSASPSASASIKVKVELADRFKAGVKADDSVMVYVKALNGPKMPLAAVKRLVKDLPMEIVFDDSMAMMPNMTISSVDKVVITARVSRAGLATPQAGEPVGTAEAVVKKDKEVIVVIDEQIK